VGDQASLESFDLFPEAVAGVTIVVQVYLNFPQAVVNQPRQRAEQFGMVLFLGKKEGMTRGYAVAAAVFGSNPRVGFRPAVHTGTHRLKGSGTPSRLEVVG
jgi:hypothetical protein